MTEPDVASSDATNMAATIQVEGSEVVLNDKKWWTTGVGHPQNRMIIFMGVSNPDNDRHHQHSVVIVPRETAGVEVTRMLKLFAECDAPYGHGEVHFNNVRVPLDHVIGGLGRGFEIAQGHLGPDEVHRQLIAKAELKKYR